MDLDKTLPGLKTNPLLTAKKHSGDRRVYPRLPVMTVSTQVKVKFGWFAQWRTVELVDFNHAGFAFLSEHSFRAGQTIIMRLRLTIDESDISVSDALAVIRNRIEDTTHFRYGAEFQYSASGTSQTPPLVSKLTRIENLVNRALIQQENSSDSGN